MFECRPPPDQRRPGLVRHEHCHVLAGARAADDVVWQSGLLQALRPGRPAVGIGVGNQRRPAAQRAVGYGVHVSNDDVRDEPAVDEGIGAPVHRYQCGTCFTADI